MPQGRLVRLSAAIAGAAAIVAAIALFTSPGALAQGCTTSWSSAVSGSWSDGGDWSNGEPTATSVACITVAGYYTVTVSGGTAQASELELGGGTGADGMTLAISASASTGGGAELQAATIDNQATIELTDPDASGSSSENAELETTTGTLTNDGTIVSEPGAAGVGTRGIDGTVDNTSSGEIEVDQTVYLETQEGDTLTSAGEISVASGTQMLIGCGTTNCESSGFDLSGGTITNDGTLTEEVAGGGRLGGSGSMAVTGGTVTGNPIEIGGASVSFNGNGSGGFTIEGNNTLSGTIGADDTVELSGSASNQANLTAESNITNDGTFELSTAGAATAIAMGSSYTLTNDGTIESVAGSSGRLGIDGDLTNGSAGTIDVNASLQIGASQTSDFITAGAITIASGQDLLVGCGSTACEASTLQISGGTITNNGDFYQDVAGNDQPGPSGSTLLLEGGALTGNPLISCGAAVTINGTGSGSFTLEGTGTLAGTVAPQDSLTLQTTAQGQAVYTASATLVNDGTIDLIDTNAASTNLSGVNLTVSSGTLTNDGTIESDAGTQGDGALQLNGNITNAAGGTIDDDSNLYVDEVTNGTFTQNGTIDVNGGVLFVGPYGLFDIDSGTIDNQGTIDVGDLGGGGTMNVSGGAESGAAIDCFGLTLAMTGDGSGSFSLALSTSFSGTIGAGDKLILSAVNGVDSSGTQSTLTATGSFTNHGTLELTDPNPAADGSYSAAVDISSGTLTNDGTIDSDPGDAGQGSRAINGDLINDGTIDVDQPLSLANGTFANAGTVQIAAGNTLTVDGSYPQSAGVTNLGGGSATLDAAGGVTLTGGTLSGSGSVDGPLQNGGQVSPSPSPATLTVDGDYTQTAGGFLTAAVTAGGNDRLAITGTATLAGTLALSTATGFLPAVGQSFAVLTASSVSGQFTTTTGLSSGPYSIAYGAAAVTLTGLAQPIQVQSPTLAVGNVTVDPPATGDTRAVFTVTLSQPVSAPVTVAYSTADGTAVAGRDYDATSGTLTFVPEQTTQTVDVTVLGGVSGTASTNFFLDVSNPVGAVLALNRGTATIVRTPPGLSGVVTPDSVGDSGTATVTFSGAGLYDASAVTLSAPGQPDLVGTDITVAADGSSVTATFDMDGAATGTRSVAIATPDAGTLTLPAAVTIVETTAPQISATVAGPTVAVKNKGWDGFVQFTNSGNVDAYGTLIEVSGFPQGTQVQIQGAAGEPQVAQLGSGETVTFTVAQIAADSTGSVSMSFVAPSGDVGDGAPLEADVLSTSADPADAPDPSLSVAPTFTTESATDLAGSLDVDGSSVPFDVTWAAAPADGQAKSSDSSSGGETSITALVPPLPAAEAFTLAPGCVPDKPCVHFEVEVARAHARAIQARSSGRSPHDDGVGVEIGGWVVGGVKGLNDAIGKLKDAFGIYTAVKQSNQLKQLSACLAASGQISATGQGPGLLGTSSGQDTLDSDADAETDLAITSLAADFAIENPAAGELAGQALDDLSSAAQTGWAHELWTALNEKQSLLAAYGPDNLSPDYNQTLLNVIQKSGCIPKQPNDPSPTEVVLSSSLDPNELTGPAGPTKKHWVAPGTKFTYTAMFQNTPKATAPADEVVVTDHLNRAKLKLATVALGPMTFGTHIITPPPGLRSWSTIVDLRPAQDTLVSVRGALDVSTGVITWTFNTLDASTGQPVADPFDGFLPPDAKPPEGEGSVSFTVSPHPGLKTGARITNQATIVFDTNKPLSTDTWVNTIDRSRPRATVTSVLPTTARARTLVKKHRLVLRRKPALLLRWRGHDAGSGVATVELYAARAGQRFKRQAINVVSHKIAFVCKPGVSYRFYVVAQSGVGTAQRGRARRTRPESCTRANR